MRSEHADRFNHDEDAPEYDEDVRNEADPIRAGYAELLLWVAQAAALTPGARVLELGSGTGNLTALLRPAREVVCVDISPAMTELARRKLASQDRAPSEEAPSFVFVEADLLEALSPPRPSAEGPFDAIVSTYAIHHLVPEERASLFGGLARLLAPGGRLVVGDLMFESEAERDRHVAQARARGDEELAETIEDEFFWLLDQDRAALESLGLRVEAKRFSDLSWGIVAARPD